MFESVRGNFSVKTVWNIISTIIVFALLGIAEVLVIFRLVGLDVFAVTSGSMEPEYKVGSLVYTKKVNPEELQVGDVATFVVSGNVVVTHRITEVINEDGSFKFRTKGDANQATDGALVRAENMIGKVVITVPVIGYVAYYLQRPPWIYVGIVVGTLLIMSVFWPSDEKNKRKERARAEITI